MFERELDTFSAFFYDNENLETVLRDLFCKCAYLPDHFTTDLTDDFQHSYVICKEIIDYLSTNIFENDPNNKVIQLLKKNFQEYFYLEPNSDLSEKSLDFRTFKEILVKSINQIKPNESQEIGAKRNSYLCDRKLKNMRYSVSCYDKLSSIHNTKLNDESKFKMRLSNKSLSLSDHELNQSGDFDAWDKSLKLELNRARNELADMRSENFKLRDQIEILRDQLRLAEDTNSQIGTELESQNRIILEHSKKSADFQSKILFIEKDMEDLRAANDDLKNQLKNLTTQNLDLNQMLDESSFLVNDKEKQLAKVIEDFHAQLDQYEKLNCDLQLEKNKLDKKNNELQSKVSYFEEAISKLYWNNKELKTENDILRGKCSNLESEVKNLQKLSRKNSFSNQNKENKIPIDICDNFQKNKVDSTKKTKTKSKEKRADNADLELVKSFSPQKSTLPNLNSFMIEQIETNLLNGETEKSDFDALADFVEDFLKFIDSIKKQHDDTLPKSDVFKLRDTNNNKTPEPKKTLSLMENLFNHLIINDHSNLKNNLQKFIVQSKKHYKTSQSLQVKNSEVSNEPEVKNSADKADLVSCDSELEAGNDKLSDSLCTNHSDQIEYFLFSSPTEKQELDTMALNSTKNSDVQEKTSLEEWSKEFSLNEKRRHNLISFDKNLTNIQITSDLVNSKLTKSAVESSGLELDWIDDENSKFSISKIKSRIISFVVSNYQKLVQKIRKDPVKFFKTTFSLLILGFSVLFFLIAMCRDDVLRQFIYVLSNFFEIKNPFDSIRAN